ncbi:MAG: hypothetical protein GYA21_10145 [Myxococcales bacterium]|nr:hypothetical protein [Myxococcales bacterium]
MKAAAFLLLCGLLAATSAAQAGGKSGADPDETPAAVAIPDLPDLPGAALTVTWDNLKQILEEALRARVPRVEETAPVPYALSQARYQAVVDGKTLRLVGEFDLSVFKAGWVVVPLFPEAASLAEATLDGAPAPLAHAVETPEGSAAQALVLRGPGRHKLRLVQEVRAPAEPGVNEALLPLPPAASARITLELPARYSDVEVANASLERTAAGGRARYQGTLGPGTELHLQYTLPAEKQEEVQVRPKGPPKVFATLNTLVSVEEASIRSINQVEFEVRDAPVTAFSIQLPKGYALAELSGTGVVGAPEPDDGGLLRVPVNFEVKGTYNLRLVADRTLEDASFDLDLPLPRAQGVEQQKGHIGVQVTSGAEITVQAARGVVGRDFSELPQAIASEARGSIMLAFGYRKADLAVLLHVERHSPMPVLDAAIDQANLVLQLTPEGHSVSQAVYLVRNNNRQFLRLRLPDKSQVWSTRVNNRPVKPSLEVAREGRPAEVLVPLERSTRSGSELAPYDVEVILYSPGEAISGLGRIDVRLPEADLPASRMEVSLFLPERRFRLGVSGDFEEESPPEYGYFPSFVLGGMAKQPAIYRAEPPAAIAAAPAGYPEEETKSKDMGARQMALEKKFDERIQQAQAEGGLGLLPASSVGTLPARFTLPRSGQLIRLTRLIVLPGAEGRVRVFQGPPWIGTFLWWLTALGALAMFWLWARHLYRTARGDWKFWEARRLLVLVAVSVAVFAVPTLVPLRDYPIFMGMWFALLIWAGRQVFFRGWPVRHLREYLRRKKTAKNPA